MHFTKVATIEDADTSALKITLHRKDGLVRGWFVGPVSVAETSIEMPYLPKSDNLLAAVAVLRATVIAETRNLRVCIVDPDDLWAEAWELAVGMPVAESGRVAKRTL